MANESADIALDFDREKKRLPIEFWKKKNGDRFKINSPILRQRYGLKLSHHPYLTHLIVQLNPALTDINGQTHFIYCGQSCVQSSV